MLTNLFFAVAGGVLMGVSGIVDVFDNGWKWFLFLAGMILGLHAFFKTKN
jgi:hypothetical protein